MHHHQSTDSLAVFVLVTSTSWCRPVYWSTSRRGCWPS